MVDQPHEYDWAFLASASTYNKSQSTLKNTLDYDSFKKFFEKLGFKDSEEKGGFSDKKLVWYPNKRSGMHVIYLEDKNLMWMRGFMKSKDGSIEWFEAISQTFVFSIEDVKWLVAMSKSCRLIFMNSYIAETGSSKSPDLEYVQAIIDCY